MTSGVNELSTFQRSTLPPVNPQTLLPRARYWKQSALGLFGSGNETTFHYGTWRALHHHAACWLHQMIFLPSSFYGERCYGIHLYCNLLAKLLLGNKGWEISYCPEILSLTLPFSLWASDSKQLASSTCSTPHLHNSDFVLNPSILLHHPVARAQQWRCQKLLVRGVVWARD